MTADFSQQKTDELMANGKNADTDEEGLLTYA
jgi:hypothetical protein